MFTFCRIKIITNTNHVLKIGRILRFNKSFLKIRADLMIQQIMPYILDGSNG